MPKLGYADTPSIIGANLNEPHTGQTASPMIYDLYLLYVIP